MLEIHLHDHRQGIQPRQSVVGLKNGLPARSQHATALLHQASAVCCVLDDSVSVDQVERPFRKRQSLPVSDQKVGVQRPLSKVRLGEPDGRIGNVDTRDPSIVLRKPNQVGSCPAPDFQDPPTRVLGKRNQAQEMMQLVEMVLVEIRKKGRRTDRMFRDFQVVNSNVPVCANRCCGDLVIRRLSHRGNYNSESRRQNPEDGIQKTAFRMFRDLSRLSDIEHDLLVIGGGISGLIAAYDAAQRGLSVALIDRGDFGGATSFNHLKTVHGGLRYLQHGDISRMRRSVRERQTFARIAPHLVSPLAFLTPATGNLARSRAAYATAFAIDAWVGRDRNVGLRADLHLPAGRVISLEECRRLAPDLDLEGASGGALWYDYQMPIAERLTFAFALAAEAQGAVLANYVEALEPVVRENTLVGVSARDVEGRSAPFEIRARATLNAAGPWARTVMAACGLDRDVQLLKALNLVTSRQAAGPALVQSNPQGRALVLAPWHGRGLIGTGESDANYAPDDGHVDEIEMVRFVGEVNATFRHLNLRCDEVTMVHRGIVPALRRNGRLTLQGEAQVLDHGRDGLNGLVTMVSVKYTTARLLAERAVDVVFDKLGRPAMACRTNSAPLPGVPEEGADLVADLLRDQGNWLAASVAQHLVATHGSGSRAIVMLASQDHTLRVPVAPALPVLHAEIVHAARHEMARTLVDVVARRTMLGTAGHPGKVVAHACADTLARELRWTPTRMSAEIDALRTFYAPVTGMPPG